jgi:hypothetical protein
VGFTKAANERLHVLRVAWRDNPLLPPPPPPPPPGGRGVG